MFRRYSYPFIMEYKILLCLLLSVVVAYADDKEIKVDAAVSLKDNSLLFISKMQTFVIATVGAHFFIAWLFAFSARNRRKN